MYTIYTDMYSIYTYMWTYIYTFWLYGYISIYIYCVWLRRKQFKTQKYSWILLYTTCYSDTCIWIYSINTYSIQRRVCLDGGGDVYMQLVYTSVYMYSYILYMWYIILYLVYICVYSIQFLGTFTLRLYVTCIIVQ